MEPIDPKNVLTYYGQPNSIFHPNSTANKVFRKGRAIVRGATALLPGAGTIIAIDDLIKSGETNPQNLSLKDKNEFVKDISSNALGFASGAFHWASEIPSKMARSKHAGKLLAKPLGLVSGGFNLLQDVKAFNDAINKPVEDYTYNMKTKLIPRNKKGGSSKNWIQSAVNPKHKGYCTPMTKDTCTPRRKALARTFKKMAKSRKHESGGLLDFIQPLIDKFKSGGKLK